MFPIFARTAYGFIYTFTVVWALGLVLVLGMGRKLVGRWPIEEVLVFGFGAIVGGRIGFFLQNQAYFAEQPADRWRVGLGGFDYWGAAAGFLVFGIIWLVLGQKNKRTAAIFFTPVIPLVHGIGWLACFFDGCGFGREVSPAWYAAYLPDNFGVFAIRIQTQLIGLFIFGLTAVVLWRWRHTLSQPAGVGGVGALTLAIQFFLYTLLG